MERRKEGSKRGREEGKKEGKQAGRQYIMWMEMVINTLGKNKGGKGNNESQGSCGVGVGGSP